MLPLKKTPLACVCYSWLMTERAIDIFSLSLMFPLLLWHTQQIWINSQLTFKPPICAYDDYQIPINSLSFGTSLSDSPGRRDLA